MPTPDPPAGADGQKDGEVLLTAAWAAFDDGRVDLALERIVDALAISGSVPEYHAARAWFLMARGDREAAEQILQAALRDTPQHPVLNWYLGTLRFQQRRLSEAREALTTALAGHGEFDDAMVTLAWVLHDLDDLPEATHYARRALAARESADRMLLLGWLYLRQGVHAEAIIQLRAALDCQPDLLEARRHLSNALQESGQLNQAVAALAEGLAIDPTADDMRSTMAGLLLHLGRGREARLHVHVLLRRDAYNGELWYRLALCLLGMGRRLIALRALRRALRHAPDLAGAALQAAWLALEEKLLAGAEQHLAQLRRATPDHEQLDLLGATISAAAKNYKSAGDHAERAVQRLPDSLQAWSTLAHVRLAQGRHAEAVAAAQAAVDRAGGEDGAVLEQLGFACLAAGRGVEARRAFEAAVERAPDNRKSWRALAELYLTQGRAPKGLAAIRAALAISPRSLEDYLLGVNLLNEQGDTASPEASAWAGALLDLIARETTTADVYVRAARALELSGRGQDARRVLQSALVALPEDGDLLTAWAWCLDDAGCADAACGAAQVLLDRPDTLARGKHLQGHLLLKSNQVEAAKARFAEAIALDPHFAPPYLRLAHLLLEGGQRREARDLLQAACDQDCRDIELHVLRAQLFLDQGALSEARRSIHHGLRLKRNSGTAWRLLGEILHRRGHYVIASRALQKALRLGCPAGEVWLARGWLALETGELETARKALCFLSQDDHGTATHGHEEFRASVREAENRLDDAAGDVEQALLRQPKKSGLWRLMTRIRLRQGRLDEAGSALATARDCEERETPANEYLEAWLDLERYRHEAAITRFADLRARYPGDPQHALGLADALLRAGRFGDALATLEVLPPAVMARRASGTLRARALVGLGEWERAANLCQLRLAEEDPDEVFAGTLLHMAAAGHSRSLDGLRLLERPRLHDLVVRFLDRAQGEEGHRHFIDLARLAAAEFPDCPVLATAQYFASGFAAADTYARRRSRVEWEWHMALQAGSAGENRRRPRPAGTPRIAYVAAHYHDSLLAPVLGAHDPERCRIFLYADLEPGKVSLLPAHVRVEPLRGRDLAASMLANAIDIAVDTVGVTPFAGQAEVLPQLVRRVAPIQCAWLGAWGGGGTVADFLLADQHSLPADCEAHYDEVVVRLDGGQWCWQPPAFAPPVSKVRVGPLRFASPVRGLRLTDAVLDTWARLLARVPDSELLLMGHQHRDWAFRRRFETLLEKHAVKPERVLYRPHQTRERYLGQFCDADIVLDAFPSNGGLCLLDALWMGAPVVTLAGTLLGERQTLSILAAVGRPEWAASTSDEYVDIAVALAANRERLAVERATLRKRVRDSSLTDARRMARALERVFAQLLAQSATGGELSWQAGKGRTAMPLSWAGEGNTRGASEEVPKISLIRVIERADEVTRRALGACSIPRNAACEIILAHAAEDPGVDEMLAGYTGYRVLTEPPGGSMLELMARAAKIAQGACLVFLAAGCRPAPDALDKIKARFEREPSLGALGGTLVDERGGLVGAGSIVYADGSVMAYGHQEAWHHFAYQAEREADGCEPGFFAVRRQVWEAVDGLDGEYLSLRYALVDFALRLRAAGYRSVITPELLALAHRDVDVCAAVAMDTYDRRRLHALHHRRLRERPAVADAQPFRDRWLAHPGYRVLLIDDDVPVARRGGGQPRAAAIVRHLAEQGYHLTIYPLATGWRGIPGHILRRETPATVEIADHLGAAGLEAFLTERHRVYDLLLVSRPGNMALVAGLRDRRPDLFAGSTLIYDAEAVFALRDRQRSALLGLPADPDFAQALADELAWGRSADRIWVVSRGEARLFREAGAKSPDLVSHAVSARPAPGVEGRRGLLFVGALLPDSPNEDGLLWLTGEVLPRLRQRVNGDFPVVVAGTCRSGKIAALAGSGLELRGTCDELGALYDAARVFVAPARFAAGIPLKVIEAAAAGVPVVASELLVRQLGWRHGEEILSARSADEFAEALARLMCDDELWMSVHKAGRKRAAADYAPEVFHRNIACALAAALPAGVAAGQAKPALRPRLAFVSPLPPAASGIADYAAELIPALDAHYEIELVAEHGAGVWSDWPVRAPEWFLEHADRYERIVYQMGNSRFHGFMFSLMAAVPGVVVLHDFFLGHLMAEMERDGLAPSGFLRHIIAAQHGRPAARIMDEHGAQRAVWDFPCNSPALESAKAIVVHSRHALTLANQWYRHRPRVPWAVLAQCHGPTERLARDLARRRLGIRQDAWLVCTFGHVTPHKMIGTLIEAWRLCPPARQPGARLIVVGSCDAVLWQQLTEGAGEWLAAERIVCTGRLSAEDYACYLAAADVAVQLRERSRGETSRGVLDCLSAGLPTIVNAHGSMSEIPEVLVLRLPEIVRPDALAEALARVAGSDTFPSSVREAQRRYVEHVHGPGVVADSLHRLIESLDWKSVPPTDAGAQRKLFVDVTSTLFDDLRTGIQRVVRAIATELLTACTAGVEVVPVVYREGGYRSAFRDVARIWELGGRGDRDDQPIRPTIGDQFLGLDFQPAAVCQAADLLQSYRRSGCCLAFVVYDILPALRPELFPAHTRAPFARWLNTLAAVGDRLVCISRAVADELACWLGDDFERQDIRHFHLGADVQASLPTRGVSPDEERLLRDMARRPCFLAVGTLEPRKGHGQIVAAVDSLWAAGRDVGLLIIGKKGWMVDALVERLERHPEYGRRLIWLKNASDELLLRAYEQSTALIAASEAEGFGLPLVEAARHGCPVIARDIPVFREVGAGHARFFAGDADALAQSLGQWLDDDALARQRQETPALLSWKQSAAQLWAALYDVNPLHIDNR